MNDVDLKPPKPKRRRWRWVAGFVVFAGLFGWFGIPYIYIHFINKPAPRLSFEQRDKELEAAAAATSAAQGATDTTAASAGSTVAAATAGVDGVDGTWNVISPSAAGYRVKEVLNGQSTEAVGRTSGVEGTVTISATSVTSVDLSVDLTSVTSDESRRDGAFTGRIMNTAEFPVALFSLSEPVTLDAIPAVGASTTVKAKGTVTMHGVEKAVEIDVTARRNASTIEVLGSIPVVFSDYGIDNPSVGFVTTQDDGVIEFLLTLGRA